MNFMDSFAHYNTLPNKGWSITASSTPPLLWVINSYPCFGIKSFTVERGFSALSTIYLGFAFKSDASGGNNTLNIILYNNTTLCLSCEITLLNGRVTQLSVKNNAGSNVASAAVSDVIGVAGRRRFIDMKFTNGEPGLFDVRLDMRSIISGNISNIVNYNRLQIASGVNAYNYVHDFWMNDTKFQGDCSIRYKTPTADVSSGFTKSSGSDSYGTIDENPYSDSDYNFSNTTLAEDKMSLPNFIITGCTIPAVQLIGRFRKESVGTDYLHFHLFCSQGVNKVKSTQFNPSDVYSFIYDTLVLNPIGTAWIAEDLNLLNCGYLVEGG